VRRSLDTGEQRWGAEREAVLEQRQYTHSRKKAKHESQFYLPIQCGQFERLLGCGDSSERRSGGDRRGRLLYGYDFREIAIRRRIADGQTYHVFFEHPLVFRCFPIGQSLCWQGQLHCLGFSRD
jgi:hypothetical protein